MWVEPLQSPAFDGLVSHSSHNKPWVRALVRRLHQDGCRIWFDEQDIPWGESLRRAIVDGIKASRHLVLVLTPQALGSEWVEWEVLLATHRDPANRHQRLLVLVAEPCDIPLELRPFKYLDVSNSSKLENEYPKIRDTLLKGRPADGRSSTPPPPNPFFYGGMVQTPHPFIGRDQELRRLSLSLSRGESHLLLGERRVGKSSLLWRLGTYTLVGWEVMLPVYVDLHQMAEPTVACWLHLVMGAISQALVGEELAGVSLLDPSLETFRGGCEALAQRGRRLTLLIDEGEHMADPSLGFDEHFLKFLRSLTNRRQLAMVVACQSSPADHLRKVDGTSPWDNLLHTTWLEPFTPAEATSLLELGRPVLTPDDHRQLLSWVGRFPGLVQAGASALYESRVEGIDQAGTRRDRVRRQVEGLMWDFFRHTDEEGRQALAQVANLLPGSPRPRVLRNLVRRGLVEETDTSPRLFASLFQEVIEEALERR